MRSRSSSANLTPSFEGATQFISNATTFSAAITLTCYYERLDKQVTVQVPGFTGTASGNPASCIFANALPASVRPSEDVTASSVMVWTGGARSNTIGKIKVSSAGVITIYRSPDEAGLWSTGTGWDACSISYMAP